MFNSSPKVVYLTAGAGGMFCGSCMHDNALARAMTQIGMDVLLVPTYTPIRTDDVDVSVDQIFFGGVNVYLQQKFPPLRWLPKFLDRFLDNPSFVRRVTSRSIDMPPAELGKLTVSMLSGVKGNQRKEVGRLCGWLKDHAKPNVLIFTNALIGGCIPEIKRQLKIPVLVTLQGDDVFLDSLPANYRSKCIALIKSLVPSVDGFIVHTEFFRNYMSEYFDIPADRIHVTPLGIDLHTDSDVMPNRRNQNPSDAITIGYLARLAPEKGFHNLVDAFIRLKQSEAVPDLKLKVAGWLSSQNQEYATTQFKKITDAGFETDFKYLGTVDRDEKIQFLDSIDALSVPTDYLEPKGLYVLEAMSCGVPVVLPAHGAFPELVNETGGGLLFRPGDDEAFDGQLSKILLDKDLRKRLAETGRTNVLTNRNAHEMARSTRELIDKVLKR